MAANAHLHVSVREFERVGRENEREKKRRRTRKKDRGLEWWRKHILKEKLDIEYEEGETYIDKQLDWYINRDRDRDVDTARNRKIESNLKRNQIWNK